MYAFMQPRSAYTKHHKSGPFRKNHVGCEMIFNILMASALQHAQVVFAQHNIKY